MRRPNATLEAERRFLIPEVPTEATILGLIRQGYLLILGPVEMRVRSGGENSVAVKIARGFGRRLEIEMAVPTLISQLLLHLSSYQLTKTRSVLHIENQRWDIDLYHESLEGLITAEAETDNFDKLLLPDWVAQEVTGDPKWTNKNLARFGRPAH